MGNARQLLARAPRPVLLAGLRHRAGVPDRLPHPAVGGPARRSPAGGVLAAQLLPRRQEPGPAAGPAARRPARPPGPAPPHPHPHRPAATLPAMAPAHVQQLRSLQAAITGIEHLITARVAACPRPRLLAPPPGAGPINLAQLLAEVGPLLDRATSAEQAASGCGTAP